MDTCPKISASDYTFYWDLSVKIPLSLQKKKIPYDAGSISPMVI